MKILITGGKTVLALKLIKAFDGEEILLGDYGEMPSIATNSYSFVELGQWNSDILAHNLLTKCLDKGVDILLPLYEAEIIALSKSLVLFEEFGLKVLLPENPQLNSSKFKDWGVFMEGKQIYASATDIQVENSNSLNGVYALDVETGQLALASIVDPQ